MSLTMRFWNDESGAVITAEAATVATIGVLGTVAGLSQVSTAVNQEMSEVAMAIRSLDQSYCYSGFVGSSSCVSGGGFTQRPVAESLRELQLQMKTNPMVSGKAEQPDRDLAERQLPSDQNLRTTVGPVISSASTAEEIPTIEVISPEAETTDRPVTPADEKNDAPTRNYVN